MMRQNDCSNHLLSIMAGEDFAALVPHLEAVDLPLGMIVAEPDRTINWMYFPAEGVVSLIASTPDGTQVESGLIGREGVTAPFVALGVEQLPYGCCVQMSGHGHRIARQDFSERIERSAGFRRLVLRFAHCLTVQTSYTALSNGTHALEVRLARWQLMIHDRSSRDDLSITHEYLSIMLAVRRPSVTQIMHVLEGKGLIHAERGCILVRNRQALEAFAGQSYGIPEREYRRLIDLPDKSAVVVEAVGC